MLAFRLHYFILVIGLCGAGVSLQGQHPDSLNQQLEQARAAGDLKAQAALLLTIGDHYFDKMEDSTSLLYTEQGLAIVPPEADSILGELLFLKGMLTSYLNIQLDQQLPLMDSAYQFMRHIPDVRRKIHFLSNYGAFLVRHLQYERAQAIMEEAADLCIQDGDRQETLLSLYGNLTGNARQAGDYAAALAYARKGIEVIKTLGDDRSKDAWESGGVVYANAAQAYQAIPDYEASAQSYADALEQYRRAGSPDGVAYVQLSLGSLNINLKRYEEARQYLEAAIRFFRQAGDGRYVASVQVLLAEIQHEKGEHQRALYYSDSVLQYFLQTKDPKQLMGIYTNRAKYQQALGQTDSAIWSFKQELALAKKASSMPFIMESYLQLSAISEKQGDFEKALQYYKGYAEYKDSSFNTTLGEKLAEERTRQQVEAIEKARNNAELRNQLLQSRNLLIVAVATGLLVLLLLGLFFYRKLQKARLQLQAQNTELRRLNLTKDKFFGLIAHDLRSPVAALSGAGGQLSWYLKNGDESKLFRLASRLDQTTGNLGKLLDNLLHWALLQRSSFPYQPKLLPLHQVVEEAVELYAPVAETKDINLHNHTPKALSVYADADALSTILRNLVNNALKYTSSQERVDIQAHLSGGYVEIQVKDNGVGIDSERIAQLFSINHTSTTGTAGEKGAGLGLTLCKELALLNQGDIRVESEPGKGSTFILRLPANP